MIFKEFEKVVYATLKNKFGKKVERRDYRKLERKKPDFYKDKSKTAGLMFLVDVTYNLYIDINIFEDYVILKFRKDDDNLMTIDSRVHVRNEFSDCNKLLDYFLKLVDEYIHLQERFKQVNSGDIPKDLIRENKIDSILNNQETDLTEITIILEDKETIFKMSQKNTLLEAAILQGLDVPYSCQVGICSDCLARVKSGTVVVDNYSMLTQTEINSGLVLTCQTYTKSNKITVDYDI